MKLLDPCERCSGVGAEPGTQTQRCTTCAGQGEVRRAQQSFFGQFVSVAPCPTCRGEGVMIPSPCKSCRGEGRQRGEHSIDIKIPPGVSSGQYMHLRGVGQCRRARRSARRRDRGLRRGRGRTVRARRRGPLLRGAGHVSAVGARRGRRGPGRHPARCRCASRPAPRADMSSRCEGRGLPRVNASGVGDLHVRIQVWTPQDLSKAEERLDRAAARGDPGEGPRAAREGLLGQDEGSDHRLVHLPATRHVASRPDHAVGR